ncbi:MAG: hypothetical protein JKX99_07545 [Robiginitomaculum sp.]|nr:hypothetical protein [Robiginitomaculum sp.]
MKNNSIATTNLDQVWLTSIDDAFFREREMLDRVKSGNDAYGCIFWESNHRCLVAPRSMRKVLEDGCARSDKAGWPVYFRDTGGDVAPQGPGIVNFSVAYSRSTREGFSISQTYHDLCNPIVSALGKVGLLGWTGSVEDCYCDGSYNVVVNDLKFAGTAQRIGKTKWDKKRMAILAHALMMIDHTTGEGVCAINRLYEDAGLEKRVSPQVITSLADYGVDESIFLRNLIEDVTSYFDHLSNAEFYQSPIPPKAGLARR